jgi:hypothetical protein
MFTTEKIKNSPLRNLLDLSVFCRYVVCQGMFFVGIKVLTVHATYSGMHDLKHTFIDFQEEFLQNSF